MNPPNKTRTEVTRGDSLVTIVVPPAFSPRIRRIAVPVLIALSQVPAVIIYIMFSNAPVRFRWLGVGVFSAVSLASALGMVARLLRSWIFHRDAETLTVIRKGILGSRTQACPWSQLKSMTTPRTGSTSSESGGSVPLYELRIEFEGMKPLRLFRGATDEQELRWIAWNLRTLARVDPPKLRASAPERPAPRPKPADSGATLTPSGEGIRIDLPPRGILTRQPGGLLIGALVLPVFSLAAGAALFVFRRHFPEFSQTALGVLGFFVLIGSMVTFREINRRRRSGVVEASRSRLRISSTALTGTRTVEWPMDQVRRVRGGFSGSTINGIPQMELQILLTDGREHREFIGRDRAELDWVAGEAGRYLPNRAPSPELSLHPASGVCQVCGVEMSERVVLCAKCRTPHHEECWHYTGQCSTFGCREIRFTKT
jgi:hypothetical protein